LLKSAVAMYLILRPTFSEKDAKALVTHTIFKIAMDTAFGWPLEVMLAIGRGSMTINNLKDAIGMSHTRTHKFVNDLIDLGVLDVDKLASERRGPKELSYKLRDTFRECMAIVLRQVECECPEL
jgi:hypothetical protein